MVATLAVILWAYGLYALFSGMSRRSGGYLKGGSSGRGYRWLALLGSTGAGLAVVLYLAGFCGQPDHNLKLSGFLGTVYAEGWPDKVDRQEYPPVKPQGPGDQPAYALLHPETPPIQVAPEKTSRPRPRPARQAKVGKTAGAPAKAASTPAKNKKDKTAAKSRTKKKKADSKTPRKAAAG